MQTKKCHKCGVENLLRADKCFNCGAKLSAKAGILYLFKIALVIGVAFVIGQCAFGH